MLEIKYDKESGNNINNWEKKDITLKFFVKHNDPGYYSVEWRPEDKIKNYVFNKNCQIYLTKEDGSVLKKDEIKNNNYPLNNPISLYFYLTNIFCVNIVCSQGVESNRSCFNKETIQSNYLRNYQNDN